MTFDTSVFAIIRVHKQFQMLVLYSLLQTYFRRPNKSKANLLAPAVDIFRSSFAVAQYQQPQPIILLINLDTGFRSLMIILYLYNIVI